MDANVRRSMDRFGRRCALLGAYLIGAVSYVIADLVTQVTAGLVSLSGGLWYASSGAAAVGLLAMAVVALPFALFLFVGEAKPGVYGSRVST